jgi:hypothetical protein
MAKFQEMVVLNMLIFSYYTYLFCFMAFNMYSVSLKAHQFHERQALRRQPYETKVSCP